MESGLDAAAEWTPEGEQKEAGHIFNLVFVLLLPQVCETEKALRDQKPAYVSTR